MSRRRRERGLALLLAAAAALAMPAGARACACCTELGQRLETTGPLRDHERAELERVKFAGTSQLYASAAFPDDVKGIADPTEKPYNLRSSREDGRFVLDLVDANGKAGQIALPVRRLTRFEVDTRDETAKDRGLGPALYKEWRIEGEARLSGTFAAGGNRALARLILHGSGNSCTDSSSFTHWSLVVTGRGVRFTLLGALEK